MVSVYSVAADLLISGVWSAGLAGVDVRLEIWPEMIHVWHAFADQMAASRRAINEAGAWMKGKLG